MWISTGYSLFHRPRLRLLLRLLPYLLLDLLTPLLLLQFQPQRPPKLLSQLAQHKLNQLAPLRRLQHQENKSRISLDSYYLEV